MNWFIKTLGGAVIGGLGWKLGADAYEAVKKRLKAHREKQQSDQAADEDGAPGASGNAGTAPHARSGGGR